MSIRSNAEFLLHNTGLEACLERFGNVHVTGSFRMDMMVWNDLDIYLEPGEGFDLYSLVGEVCRIMRPSRFDGIVEPQRGKQFFGFETFITGERWNVDIWIKDESSILASIGYCDGILRHIEANPSAKHLILEIKSALIARKMYGFDKDTARHYHSNEIYAAVLNGEISSPEEFLEKYPL